MIALAIALSCAACHGKGESDTTVAAAPETPVPAPDGLLAEGAMTAPDATWQRLQHGVAGGAGLLPATVGGLVAAATGLDAEIAAEIDGKSPVYAVVAGDVLTPGWVIAARLVDPRHTHAVAEAETSHVQVTKVGDYEILSPRDAAATRTPHVVTALASGWFLLAHSAADLPTLAPYATRTLSKRPPAAEPIAVDIPGAVLAGALRNRIAAEWNDTKRQMLDNDRQQRAQHGGRPPDFGDPGAIVAGVDGSIQSRLAVLGDLKDVHLGIDPGETDVKIVMTAPPASPDGPASHVVAGLHPGDTAPLRAVGREAALALLVRDGAEGRAKDAADLEAVVDSSLGARLGPVDAKKVHTAIDEWTAARGDAWTLALTTGSSSTPSRGVRVDALASDPARLAHALHLAADLFAHVPAFREPLSNGLGVRDVVFGMAEVPGGGKAETASLRVPGNAPPPYTLAWSPGVGDVKVALADSPLPLLSPLPPGSTLGDVPTVRALLDPLGDVSGAVVLQPGRAPSCPGETGGIALAWGRRDVNGVPALWVQALASDGAIRCLARSAL